MVKERPLEVHVVTHTHWDREWYHPVGRFRQRLVALIDELLGGAADPASSFLLDGQAVVLEDYLAVRPERAAELSERLRTRAIEAGPWYVLADELIPGGEALVRNLLAGRRIMGRMRASPPPVLYCPDSFGHPAALPTLAAGFGMPMIIVWRGLGGATHPSADTVRWAAADGATAITFHLPQSGYELGSSLPAENNEAPDRWASMREQLAPRCATGVTLLPNGADHHALQLRLDDAVAALTRAALPDRVVRSSLGEFAVALQDAATGEVLEEVGGELRDSYGYAWTLQGTFGVRAAQKRQAARAERLLLREAEPWAALARCHGGAARRHHIDAAWRSLLLCHPHDTLCGCSTDEVARAMDVRLEDALVQGAGIRDDALMDLAGHDPVAARAQGHTQWRPVVIIRNPAPRPRHGVAEVEIDTFIRHVPVGPGSGAAAVSGATTGKPSGAPDTQLPASLGLGEPALTIQVLDRTLVHARTESPRHYPDNDLVERSRVVAWVDDVPAFGVRSVPLQPGGKRGPRPGASVSARGRTLDNGLIRVETASDRIIVRQANAPVPVAAALLGFEDIGDGGDLYTHSPSGETRQATLVRSRVGARGPLRAELETVWRLRVVSATAGPAVAGPGAKRARRATAPVDITAIFTLDADAPFARLRVHGTNPLGDHRMRVVFASGAGNADIIADAAFGPVTRTPVETTAEARRIELPPPTAPLHRYVTAAGAESGLTIVSDGLAEYEASAEGTIAVTLLRAVGELSRNDLAERPGHAGWPVPTPAAQSPGPFEARFAMLPHGAYDESTATMIERAAEDALLPLTGTTLRSALRLSDTVLGAELLGEGLAFGALKDSEDGEWTVLRCVNLHAAEREGRWCLGFPIAEARLARLDETPLSTLPVEGREVGFTAPPRGTVTILVRPG